MLLGSVKPGGEERTKRLSSPANEQSTAAVLQNMDLDALTDFPYTLGIAEL